MAFINLKCASCGAPIQMDDTQQVGFCMYCGSKYTVKDEIKRIIIEHQGQMRIDRDEEIRNLLIRAKEKTDEYIKVGNFYDVEGIKLIIDNYLEKALDLQPDNGEARELVSLLLSFISVYRAKLTIMRIKQKVYNMPADITIGGQKTTLQAGKEITFDLPLGQYDIVVEIHQTLEMRHVRFKMKNDVYLTIRYNHFSQDKYEIDIQGAERIP